MTDIRAAQAAHLADAMHAHWQVDHPASSTIGSCGPWCAPRILAALAATSTEPKQGDRGHRYDTDGHCIEQGCRYHILADPKS